MGVYDHDLFATVPGHFVGGFLKQTQLQLGAIGDGARLMLRLKNLPRKIVGENDGVLFLGRVLRDVPRVEQVCSDRQMGSVFFENPDRQGMSNRVMSIETIQKRIGTLPDCCTDSTPPNNFEAERAAGKEKASAP